MNVPDFIGPLVGWRHWTIDSLGFLCAVNESGRRWPGYKPIRARCDKAGSAHWDADGRLAKAPQSGCTCGVYAYKSEESDLGEWAHVPVRGSVYLWGHIIEHELGYRAEFAYPNELVATNERTAARLRRLYGVPCVVREIPRMTMGCHTSVIPSAVWTTSASQAIFAHAPQPKKKRRWWIL